MPKHHGKPIERYPHDVVLPFGWHATRNYGLTYRVKDGDSWESVAERFWVDVKELIYFNFLTVQPDEVNWYLHHHTGCNRVSPSGNNWMFSNSANPGIIFIPPAEHDPIDMDPEEICPWTPGNAKEFTRRLATLAKQLPGYKGERIQTLAGVIADAGYPEARKLWYYNPAAIHEYVQFHTNNATRRDMTQDTKGAYPFDGSAGVAGPWRMYPARDLFDDFACRFDVSAVEFRLKWIDEQMRMGWHDLELVDAQSVAGGGTGYGEEVWNFISSVKAYRRTSLTSIRRSLRSRAKATDQNRKVDPKPENWLVQIFGHVRS
jgi:hypothetical protein